MPCLKKKWETFQSHEYLFLATFLSEEKKKKSQIFYIHFSSL